ncbi:MAG TPA: hypothetical protein VK691_09170 [Solirubrobacteraceae bacterium]|nr:hypothetical protein [Solirubrobacteraceae bacterium]
MSALTMAVGASAASASTFFVNGATGLDTNPCTSAAAPCKTIGAAVTKSELTIGNATIEVAAGTYKESLDLDHPADNGITINGVSSEASGTVIEGAGTEPTFQFGSPESSAAVLSNLRVVTSAGQTATGIESAGELTLNNVAVDVRSAGDYGGIKTEEFGSLTINGGSVTMETGNKGTAIEDEAVPLSLKGVQLTVANGAEGTALTAGLAAVSLSNVTIDLGNTATDTAIETELPSPLSVNGLAVSIANPSDSDTAVEQEFGTGTYEHLQVGGAWTGPALESEGGATTIRDSRLTTTGAEPAIVFGESGEGPGLLFQRSIASVPPTAPYAVFVVNGNATLDSSEVLGGQDALALEQSASKQRTLTIAGSTVDAGVLGERDASGVHGVAVESAGTASVADVNIEGSIVIEPQMANTGPGDTANVSCTYSDVPNQTQAATGTEGAIACASGVSGNTTTSPLTSLFSTPITNYALLPGSSAIDSVPASAISLPFGITPSSTDLAGNPRVVDGNGDCAAVQDKGALELQGHAAPCPAPAPAPAPPPAKPVAGAITGLTISPSSFFAAPSGATISTSKKPKKTYGATVAYHDSQVATTTFTVLSVSQGRTQGKACKKASKVNKHGKRCTIYTPIGSFTHVDIAGANTLHFSGRIKGKTLAKGSYRLQAVPHDAAGNGAVVSKEFKIKG